MKRLFVSVVLVASFVVAPLAHAQTTPVPIGNPYTDTIQLWSEIASALSSLANDFATLFNGHEVASTNAPSNSQQGSASLAATVASFDQPQQAATSAPASTSSNTTSDQTTLSQNVKSANTEPPGSQSIVASVLSNPAPAFNASNFVTQSELAQVLLALSNSPSTKSAPTTAPVLPEWVAADGNPFVPYAAVSNIGQLSNVTITNANLSASEIPDLNYFPATSTVSVGYGGTGTSNAPTYGQLLLGNGNGGYTLAATSSLGILSGSSLLPSANTWSALNLFAGGASTTNFSNFGTAYFGGAATSTFNGAGVLSLVSNGLTVGTNQLVVSGGDIGIGTTSPSTTLSVNGNGYITGNWTATNYYGSISSTTVLATGATTARAIGDIAADVVNVKSFGATGNGTADDSAAINAAISYIRNADDAAGGGALNKYELHFPRGKYLIDSSINLTCYSDPNSISGTGYDDGCRPNGGGSEIGESHGALPIVAAGAQIVCSTSGAPCIDGLGSRQIQISGLTVYGSCTAGSEPNWGIQIGRTEPGVGADDWYFHSMNFEGCYNKAAYYNLASEDTTIDGDSWFQNQDTNNTFATSTGPYSAVWDSGNHWQVTSAFVTEAIPKDLPNSFNDNTVDGGSFYPSSPSSHSGGIWIYGTRRLTFINSYVVSQQGSCVNIYFDASSPGSLTGNTDHAPQDDNFQIHCEGVLSNIFLITGQQSHPLIMGLRYADHAVGAGNGAGSVFALEAGVAALTLQNVDINVIGSGCAPKTLWDTPSAYTVSGTVTVPAAGGNTTWVAPGTWTGCVYIGTASPSCGGLTNTGMLNITSSTGGTIAFDNDPILYASSTLSDVFVGFSTGAATTTTGTYDTAVGWQALSVNAAGIRDTAFGYQALQGNTGTDNAALGNGAARLVTSNGDITAIGAGAMVSHTGANDTAIGAYSLDASGNGNNDTALGYEAGFADTSGAQNTFLGFHAASTTASGSDNIALCYACDLPSANGSNQLDIGNLVFGTGINGTLSTVSTGNIGIGTTTPSARLSVWGSDAASSTAAFNVVNSASTTVFSVFDGGNAELSGSLSQSSD